MAYVSLFLCPVGLWGGMFLPLNVILFIFFSAHKHFSLERSKDINYIDLFTLNAFIWPYMHAECSQKLLD